MRWFTFVIFAFIALVAETSLQGALVIRSFGNLAPSFVAVLAAFVCLFAVRRHALWACWGLGLVVDLLTRIVDTQSGLTALVGPHALGYTIAGAVVLQLRPALFRRRPLTIAIVTVLFVAVSSLVSAILLGVHGWYPGEALVASEASGLLEVLRQSGIAVYSGVLALLLGTVLVWTLPLWGFGR